MLTRLHIENFKLHAETTLDTARITLFIGPNNSGKSSVFQALLALRQAAAKGSRTLFESYQRRPTSDHQPYLFPESGVVDIGEFRDAVRHGQDVIRLGVIGTIHRGNPFLPGAPVEASFAMDVRSNFLTLHHGQITCPPAELKWEWSRELPESRTRVSITADGFVLWFSAGDSFRLIHASGYQPPSTIPSNAAVEKVTRIGEVLAATPTRLLGSLHPVFPVRGFEELGYPLPEKRPTSLDCLTVSDRGVALAGLLAYDRDLEERVSQRLTELLNIRIKVRLVEGKRVTVWAEPSDRKCPASLFVNEGTAANQLPFILVPIALAPPNETVFLSEPEAHLHPKKQYELTSQLVGISNKENIQFFIETHSEHVLHALLHAVARGELARNGLAVYYFENVDGVAKRTLLKVNDQGQVEGGLPGFFEQSLTELSDYLDALRKA